MTNKPFALTREEIKEIASNLAIQEMWGAQSFSEMEDTLKSSCYAVKFQFVSGCPGYVGDLFVIHGDNLEQPLRLIRNHEKRLEFVH